MNTKNLCSCLKLPLIAFLFLLLSDCQFLTKNKYTFTLTSSKIRIRDSESPLNGFKLDFGENDLPRNTKITIRKIDDIPALPHSIIMAAGPGVDISMKDGNQAFDKPVSITIPLNRKPNKILFIGYYNENIDKWEYIAPDTNIISEDKVTFQTRHFSLYVPFVMDIGNFKILLNDVQKDYKFQKTIREAVKKNLSTGELSKLRSELEALQESYLNEMYLMTEDYDDCKERWSCDLVYSDLPGFLHQQFISTTTEHILIDAVLKTSGSATTGGVAVIKIAFTVGSVITDLVLVDCISCFLPNSIVSKKWWSVFIRYHYVTYLLDNMNKRNNIGFDESFLGVYGKNTRIYKKGGVIYLSYSLTEDDDYELVEDDEIVTSGGREIHFSYSAASSDFGVRGYPGIHYFTFSEDEYWNKYLMVQYAYKDYHTEKLYKTDMNADFTEGNIHYSKYKSDENHFEIELPNIFLISSEPLPSSYKETKYYNFISSDRKASVMIIVNYMRDKPDFNNYINNKSNVDITYKVVKDNWFVISGYDVFERNTIFYQKTIFNREYGTLIDFYIRYPKDDKLLFNEITANMSTSFKTIP